MLHLLDTDIASYIIRRRSPEIEARLSAIEPSLVCVSVITRAELLYGLKRLPPGQPIGELDMMIAAHSLAAAAVLVTNNTRHFERIPAPLILQNWTAPAPATAPPDPPA